MSRIIEAFKQFFDDDGQPLTKGWLLFLESGTVDSKKNTYYDSSETIANTNPLQLDASGRCPNVFGSGAYKVISYTNDELLNEPAEQMQVFDPVSSTTGTNDFSDWSADALYQEDDIVKGPDGNFYRSIASDNTNQNPTTETEYWEQIDFFRLWNEFVVYSSGEVVNDALDGLFYRSLVDNNVGNVPSTDGGTNWANLTVGGSAILPDIANVSGVSLTMKVASTFEDDLLVDGNAIYVDQSTGYTGFGGVPIYFHDVVGDVTIGNSRADAVAKSGVLESVHYTIAEEPITMMYTYSDASNNQLAFGGGYIGGNSATEMTWYLGATNTTLIGTANMKLNSTGLAIGHAAPNNKLDVLGAVRLGDNRTNATQKVAAVFIPAYNNSTVDPIMMIGLQASSSVSTLYVGGGGIGYSSTYPTRIRFQTAANITSGSASTIGYMDQDYFRMYQENVWVDDPGGGGAERYLGFSEFETTWQAGFGIDAAGALYVQNVNEEVYIDAKKEIIFKVNSTTMGRADDATLNWAFGSHTAPDERVDILGNIKLGGSRTTATDKYATIVSPHYTITETDIGMIYSANTTGNNLLYIGGGNANYNAATQILFKTAGTTTTLSGTTVGRFDSDGNFAIGDHDPIYPLDIIGNAVMLGNNRDAATNVNNGFIVGAQYDGTTETEGYALIGVNSGSTYNIVAIGGGNGTYNAATNIYFYTTNSGVSTRTGTLQMVLNGNGRLGIGTSSPQHILDAVGDINIGSNRTATTDKTGRLLSPQYDSGVETEGFALLRSFANVSSQSLSIGGGDSAYNACTTVNIYTATDTTTRTGNLAVSWNSFGACNFQGNNISNLNLRDYSLDGESHSGTGTIDIDSEDANVHYMTITGATTFTFSNAATSGKLTSFTLELTNGGSATITWPASVNWDGGTAPTLQSSGKDQVSFTTLDGGTTWLGRRVWKEV